VLVLSDCLDALLDDVLLHAIKTNPLLAPSADPPQPWTQVRTGGLPSGHWAQPSLIRDHHPSIENAARHAIGAGRMQPLLDALHVLQTVPFTNSGASLSETHGTDAIAATAGQKQVDARPVLGCEEKVC
jgi:DNA-directed RNA polymerase